MEPGSNPSPNGRSCLFQANSVQFSSVAQLCPTLCYPMDYSPPGSSVHGIFQARILDWIAISFSRGSSQPRGQTSSAALAGGFLTTEPPRQHVQICRFYLKLKGQILSKNFSDKSLCSVDTDGGSLSHTFL